MRRFYYSLAFILFLLPFTARSQDSLVVTLDSSKVYFFYNDFDLQGSKFISLIDTLITGVQKYDPLLKSGNYFASLGNIGLAHTNLEYKNNIKSGFDFGFHSYDQYMFHNSNIKYYWIGRPFTNLQFIMGPNKEQNLHIDHSQNVSSWFNIGLRFRYTNSPGYYNNQKSDDKNFVITTRFQTRNYRYIVLANYIHNKLKVEENGGIVYDSVFEDNSKTARNSINVNLSTAKNQIIQNGFYVKQSFKLSKRNRFNEVDSNNFHAPIFNPGTISLSTHLLHTSLNYFQDLSDSAFYSVRIDSINPTVDSTHIYIVENELAWTNADNIRAQHITFYMGIKHLYTELTGFTDKRIYNQLIPKAGITFFPSRKLSFDFYGDFVTGNSNVGDFNLFGKVNFNTKFGKLSFKSNLAQRSIAWFYQFYSSNHFNWDNNFTQQLYFINTFEYKIHSFTSGIEVTSISDYQYMDTFGIPKQFDKSQNVLRAYIQKLFEIGNWSFDGRLIYQRVSAESVLHLPMLIGDFSAYYTKDLFKQAAVLQTGFDIRYNTSYYADAYMPATRSFYLQNEKKIGDYVYADLFLNLQIKRARLFLKYQNLASIAQDYRYYTVPSYPMQDHGYRFGLSWMFYD